MAKNNTENAASGSRENEQVRESGENIEVPENDALAWYFNRTVSEPWDRLLEVQECVEQEFYINNA